MPSTADVFKRISEMNRNRTIPHGATFLWVYSASVVVVIVVSDQRVPWSNKSAYAESKLNQFFYCRTYQSLIC